jgi:hypothetical protein
MIKHQLLPSKAFNYEIKIKLFFVSLLFPKTVLSGAPKKLVVCVPRAHQTEK